MVPLLGAGHLYWLPRFTPDLTLAFSFHSDRGICGRVMNLRTQRPTHPGEILRDWMDGKQVSVADTASLLDVSSNELNLLLSCDAPLPPTLAVRLERIGWGNAESWAGTQTLWDIAQARQQLGVPVKATDTDLSRRTVDLGFDVRLDVPGGPRPMYRPRCASIIVASSGPDEPERYQTRFGEIRSRSGASLKYTARDAESVYALWRKEEEDLPDELHLLLIDPTVGELECALRDVSARILEAYPDDVGLDFFFAGHGKKGTGNLVLKEGTLSPTRLLELQAGDVGPGTGGQRTIGVWLDSCYSGAFLLRLALAAFEDFEGFRLDEGLASCLPDETCGETAILEHGVFTYTRLHPGNSHVDQERFNRAILENNPDELAKGLQGLVGMTSNPSAFLTEGRQFSVSLTKHVISVEGGFATVELDEKNDFVDVCRRLTNFKKAPV